MSGNELAQRAREEITSRAYLVGEIFVFLLDVLKLKTILANAENGCAVHRNTLTRTQIAQFVIAL